VINSDPQSINVVALFVPEALLRDIDLEFGTPGSTAGPTPPADPPVDPSPPTIGTVTETAGPAAAGFVTAKKATKARVAVSYLRAKGGKRFLVVRVASSKRWAHVRVALIGKGGRKLGTVTKLVRTNRLVTIRVKGTAKRARVSLVR
jgi:hypothetical protein